MNGLHKYYPPIKDWRFWVIQFVAILISILHSALEGAGYFVSLERLYFVPISLLVVPVVFAALIFGFAGSISTAIWVVILSIPNLVFGHDGFERFGEIFQLGILVTLAIIMGQRVDRELSSRNKIITANAALEASEKKYRGIFDSSPFPILVLDKNNIIIDANPSAGSLLDQPPDILKGTAVSSVSIKSLQDPPSTAAKERWWETSLVTIVKRGSMIYLQPTYSSVTDIWGNAITQILLRDVTEDYQRRAGLKAYTAYILQAQEEERQHIARELHDETIQTLALLCRQLDSIDSSSRFLPAATVEELRKAREIAEKVVTGLRDFTRSLRPPILDDLGVVASIRRLLVDFMERTKVSGQLEIHGKQKRLPPDIEVGIFRIAQEALWNVERHAEAANVGIDITFAEYTTILTVKDDGKGFNVPTVIGISSASSQLGLVGMQERAELFGGRLEITSSPGKGTSITVTIPSLKNVSENKF